MPVLLDTETSPTAMPVVYDLTITAAGPFSYTVPAGSLTADVDLWGAGGGGGGKGTLVGGGGGGGGAQTSAPGIATIPHALVSGVVGTGGAAGAAGLPGADGTGSNYINAATAFADFGLGGEAGNGTQGPGGARGAAAHCEPTGRNGGNGGGGSASADGGGGGGSAGTTGAAGAGSPTGTAGTAGTGGGAAGGTGAAGAVAATAASAPGGGGGGASTLAASSAGRNGQVVVSSNNARWDAILTGSAPGQTFSIFVDVAAVAGIEVRNNERYNGNTASWDVVAGNLGVKVFGVKTEVQVETAINAFAGLATVTTPGTTPTATFSDTPLAGINAPFLTAVTIDDAIASCAIDVANVSYVTPAASLFVQMNLWITGMFSEATGIFPPSLDDDNDPGQRVVTDWFAQHLIARDTIEGPLTGDAGVVGTSAVIDIVVRVLYAVKYGLINGNIATGQQNAVIALYNLVWEP